MDIIKVGVGVIIFDEKGRLLLGHRVGKDTGGIYEPGSWCLPGGKQEYGETIEECATREVKEETNLDIFNVKVIGCHDDIQVGKHFITIETVTNVYEGEVKVMERNKQDEWKWFYLDNLPKNLYSPSEKSIKSYLRLIK